VCSVLPWLAGLRKHIWPGSSPLRRATATLTATQLAFAPPSMVAGAMSERPVTTAPGVGIMHTWHPRKRCGLGIYLPGTRWVALMFCTPGGGWIVYWWGRTSVDMSCFIFLCTCCMALTARWYPRGAALQEKCRNTCQRAHSLVQTPASLRTLSDSACWHASYPLHQRQPLLPQKLCGPPPKASGQFIARWRGQQQYASSFQLAALG
jgi:hypothetical protein